MTDSGSTGRMRSQDTGAASRKVHGGACAAVAGWGRREARRTVVWDAIRRVLDQRSAQTGRSSLDIVDAGGGTGGFAVPLAVLGHTVTVVDPSPDSLAAAERRAAETHVPIQVVQGEAAGLDSVLGERVADLVICHSVLEYVESPREAMSAVARILRPDATVSVLAANAAAAVLHRAVAGRLVEARVLLDSVSSDVDPEAQPPPRRFTLPQLTRLLDEAGLRVDEAHGVRVFADLVPGALLDADPEAAGALQILEETAAAHPAFRAIAAHLHVLGRR